MDILFLYFLIDSLKLNLYFTVRQNDFLISLKYPAHNLHLLIASIMVVGFSETQS